jgi:hypothetical protein
MSNPIHIPNPLYDVVFRYMMDDERVARLVLTAILGQTVEALEFQSTEQALKLGEAQITVTRMDFRARIRQDDGQEKMVLIELQKAKLYYQIGRFRRYLGQQYQHNPQTDKPDSSSPLPIYPIYILGEPYSDNGIPVVRVHRETYDASTSEPLAERHPFIEALTHDAIIVQTRYLTGKRRTDLERFLSIFDQAAVSDTKGHILTLNETDFPERYQPVIRRLQQVMTTPQLEADMDLEDEVLREFEKKEEEILAMRQLAEQERAQKEEERRQKEQAQRETVEAQRRFVRFLADQGNDIETICQLTGLAAGVVTRLLAG